MNNYEYIDKLLDGQIELEELLMEDGILQKIHHLASRGLTVGMIAAALSLTPGLVQNALAKEPAIVNKVGTTSLFDIGQNVSRPNDWRIAGMTDVEVLARTIYREAGNESIRGKRGVASTIYNRAKGDSNKMIGIVLAKKQYSVWNDGATPAKGKETDSNWQESLKIAQELLSGKFVPIFAHTSYFNPRLVQPDWAKGLAYTTIGRHRFMTVQEDLI